MIGIIGAMEVEVEELKNKMTGMKTFETAGMLFCIGLLEGKEAVLVRSGIGKVNAAVCTQILINQFKADVIINTGIAGSLRNEINIGDIVLSEDAVEHDMDAVAFGYPVGQIPQMNVFSFKADEKLIQLAKECNEAVNPEIGTHVGRVVSGDQFISSKEKKQWLTENFAGYCAEMEGAAIAHAAYLSQVPYLVIRAISDKADDSAGMDYAEFEAQAIRHTVRLVTAMLQKM